MEQNTTLATASQWPESSEFVHGLTIPKTACDLLSDLWFARRRLLALENHARDLKAFACEIEQQYSETMIAALDSKDPDEFEELSTLAAEFLGLTEQIDLTLIEKIRCQNRISILRIKSLRNGGIAL